MDSQIPNKSDKKSVGQSTSTGRNVGEVVARKYGEYFPICSGVAAKTLNT